MLTFDRALVTGGAGFIGSHTVDALLEDGVEVWVLDDLSTGRLSNLRTWRRCPGLHFKRGSITDYRIVEKLTRRVDVVVHLAATVSPELSLRRPELTNEINVSGTLNVLRAGLKNHVKRILFASSSSLYGDPRSVPISEDAPLNPITPYGVSKLAAERYCRVYHKALGLSTISLRYFNVYGERQGSNAYSGVIAIFAERLLKGQRPIIYGDGSQTRDFIHVSDAVRANILALRATNGGGEAFNIGSGQATTIKELLHFFAESMGKAKVFAVSKPARKGDIRESCASIAKARSALGFRPKITIRHGLRLLVDSLRS